MLKVDIFTDLISTLVHPLPIAYGFNRQHVERVLKETGFFFVRELALSLSEELSCCCIAKV